MVLMITMLLILVVTCLSSAYVSAQTQGDGGDLLLGMFLSEVVNITLIGLLHRLPWTTWLIVGFLVLVPVVYFLGWLSIGLVRAATNRG